MEKKVRGFNLGVGYVLGITMLYQLQQGNLFFGILMMLLSITNITIAYNT